MSFALVAGSAQLPHVVNEPLKSYAPGSAERAELKETLKRLGSGKVELPCIIGGRPVRTGQMEMAIAPHDHQHVLGEAHLGGVAETNDAIEAAKRAAPQWSRMPWEERAAIFLRAAELLSGPRRALLNAATMLGQSKTAHQAEIDSAAELIDFWRWNVEFMARIYREQPQSGAGAWNRVDYRPLEGFVFAVTPFNFTAIAGNLPSAPALMGNTVVWKPSATAKYSAHFIMEILHEAGLPDGVINLVYGKPAEVAEVAIKHPDLAGIHFTGSTSVFNNILARVGAGSYRNYPRVVGETGGKNFVVAHASADVAALVTGVVRGGYEYQGQKCSAASRIFVPRGLWPEVRDRLVAEIQSIRVGDVADFRNFMSAVIDEKSWRKLSAVIADAKGAAEAKILAGGSADMSTGYFVQPTLLEVTDPASRYMQEEFFGPIVSAYVYDENKYEDLLGLIDRTSAYGLTGAVFARDRSALGLAADRLRYAAGNFYVNDKPTGAVVGQQPFGGARQSGTNDKAGSMWNLMRWVSPRTIKETLVSATDYRYPFMEQQ
ncbi:MAG: L-glutamate gamma-semialdehyde dehydrogenase [Steroidobacteraceae bacterium]